MIRSRNQRLFGFTIGSLLSLWALFGCLELAESMTSLDEPVSEDQEAKDLDLEALLQLAYGVRSDSPTVVILVSVSVIGHASEELVPFAAPISMEPSSQNNHSPPSLRLHQQISVYRI